MLAEIPPGFGRVPFKIHRFILRCNNHVDNQSRPYSVFFCVLRDIDRVRMQSDLENEMNLKEDQALILELDSDEDASRRAVTTIGEPLPKQGSGTVVI